MTPGLLYYTDNQCQERILLAARNQLNRCRGAYRLVSVSQYPIVFGRNIVVPMDRSAVSMFYQILVGLEALESDTVFMLEHDVFYHPSHFDFEPLRDDTYYYNLNVWNVDADTGQALHYDGMRMTSGLVAHRKLLLEHYRKRLKVIEAEGFSVKRMGYEPGKRGNGIDKHSVEYFESAVPNINIKHGGNLTPGRFKLSQYRRPKKLEASWVLADEVPGWGRTKGRFGDFVRGLA